MKKHLCFYHAVTLMTLMAIRVISVNRMTVFQKIKMIVLP